MTIDGLTSEQRFFLGLAWGLRGGPALINWKIIGPTRNRVAVNGVLSALLAFSQAFGCQTGAPMAGGNVWYRAPWHTTVLSAHARDELARDYERIVQGSLEKILSPASGRPSQTAVTVTAAQQATFEERRQ